MIRTVCKIFTSELFGAFCGFCIVAAVLATPMYFAFRDREIYTSRYEKLEEKVKGCPEAISLAKKSMQDGKIMKSEYDDIIDLTRLCKKNNTKLKLENTLGESND